MAEVALLTWEAQFATAVAADATAVTAAAAAVEPDTIVQIHQ